MSEAGKKMPDVTGGGNVFMRVIVLTGWKY